jgi:hypothetical protein
MQTLKVFYVKQETAFAGNPRIKSRLSCKGNL